MVEKIVAAIESAERKLNKQIPETVWFDVLMHSMANWKSKPATMINKVAISQCVRDAFPKDYEGLYSEEEMVASGAIPTVPGDDPGNHDGGEPEVIISQEQRKQLFAMAQNEFGQENGNAAIRDILATMGMTSTINMTASDYNKVMDALIQMIQVNRNAAAADAGNAQ